MLERPYEVSFSHAFVGFNPNTTIIYLRVLEKLLNLSLNNEDRCAQCGRTYAEMNTDIIKISICESTLHNA